MKVRLFKPCVGSEELEAIQGAFSRAWLGLGEKVYEFESAWSSYIGAKSSIGVNSGTAALHMALAAYRFPRGKKVLVPTMTFIASAVAAVYNGLDPIFVDIDEETLGMDIEDMERKITPDTVAVVAVHMGGHPLPMERINDVARKYNLKVIEDCAHCAGGEYNGKKLGTWGDIGCFSFEEKKGMTTGDGGMMSSDDVELMEYIKPMRWVGIDKDTWKREDQYYDAGISSKHWYYDINLVGYKYNMNDLCASIGLAQLPKLDTFNANKRRAIKRYIDGLSSARTVRPLLPYDTEGNSAYWIMGVRAQKRDDLILHLKKHDIATSVHYTPLTMQPLFRDHTEPVPVAEKVYDEMLTLPLYADISDEEVDYVVENILAFDKTV